MELVALLSTGKGTWGQVSGLIKNYDWDKIILVGPNYAKEFEVKGKETDFIEFNPTQNLVELKNHFKEKFKGKIKGTEVALSIASGDGKEHMALMSGLLSVPVGIRFAALTKDGIVMM
jgi:hypothetical protein